jgi:hypothetical protein
MRIRFATLAFLTLLAGPAGAASDDAWLYGLSDDGRSAVGLNTSCRAKADELADCYLVIASALAVHHIMVANHPELAAYCRRTPPTLEQARTAFLRWYDRLAPQVQGNTQQKMAAVLTPGAVAVIVALRDESPCP